jgi:MarR family transcriptional regulator, organic hydroperoxide resistance regulator
MKKFILNDSIGFLIGTTGRALAASLNKNLSDEQTGITFEQWTLLVRLWQKDGQSQQEIANCCQKDKTTITRLIDNLEKLHYVVRMEDKSDRRNKLIYLTELGKSMQEKLMPVAEKTIKDARAGISEEEMEVCKNVLRKIKENLGQ